MGPRHLGPLQVWPACTLVRLEFDFSAILVKKSIKKGPRRKTLKRRVQLDFDSGRTVVTFIGLPNLFRVPWIESERALSWARQSLCGSISKAPSTSFAPFFFRGWEIFGKKSPAHSTLDLAVLPIEPWPRKDKTTYNSYPWYQSKLNQVSRCKCK